MDPSRKYTLFPPARFSAIAFIAIGAALFSFLLTFTGHPIWGLLLAAGAGPVGLVGLIRAVSPEIRGGLLSFFAIALSALGVIVALVTIVLGLPAWLAG